MGAYLSEPNINKESFDEQNDFIAYGASSMQGWRLSQEVIFEYLFFSFFDKLLKDFESLGLPVEI
jgi:hypothetical protein